MAKTEDESPLIDPIALAAAAKAKSTKPAKAPAKAKSTKSAKSAKAVSKAKSADAKAPPKAKLVEKPKKEPRDKTQPNKSGYIWGMGRRKRSVARVRIRPGKGEFLVNKKKVDDYFARRQDRNAALAPLKATDKVGAFDVFVNVSGGGTTGQAGATMLGIARALRNYDDGLLEALRDGGYLTRDSRMVERKKPGQRGARRRFQFSKR
jgi:small subunit ribosomal protein S9